MSNIALIKNPGILREGILKVLQDKLTEHKVTVYGSKQHDLINIESNLADLLIIDMDTNIDIFKTIELYADLNIKIAVWTSEIEVDQLTELFKLGLHGYFYNGMESSELIFAIKSMLNGKQYIHPTLSPILLSDYLRITGRKVSRPNGILTEREWDVLELIVDGENNCNIAEILFLSTATVKNHVRSIFKKLHVTDRTKAALLAVKNNWFVL